MNGCQITALVTAAANQLACSCSPEELALLAAICTQLGDTLVTLLAQRDLQEKVCPTPGRTI